MSLAFLIQLILILAILGFCFALFMNKVPIASPFREMIYFIVCIVCVLWLLNGFGIFHGSGFHWRN